MTLIPQLPGAEGTHPAVFGGLAIMGEPLLHGGNEGEGFSITAPLTGQHL